MAAQRIDFVLQKIFQFFIYLFILFFLGMGGGGRIFYIKKSFIISKKSNLQYRITEKSENYI